MLRRVIQSDLAQSTIKQMGKPEIAGPAHGDGSVEEPGGRWQVPQGLGDIVSSESPSPGMWRVAWRQLQSFLYGFHRKHGSKPKVF